MEELDQKSVLSTILKSAFILVTRTLCHLICYSTGFSDYSIMHCNTRQKRKTDRLKSLHMYSNTHVSDVPDLYILVP